MIDTSIFGTSLKSLGYDFYSGVPCSFLKDLLNFSINECQYVMAANEGDAVAICAGAQLAGKKTVVLMQNSGLGNAVSPLTSLNQIFNIPVLGFVSLRGEKGVADEPQHDLMGVITDTMLETMNIPYAFLSDVESEALAQLSTADKTIQEGKPFFFIVRKNTFSKISLKQEKKIPVRPELPKRCDLFDSVKKGASSTSVFIATTGFTGRELFETGDTDNNLYMVGSLGCASSIALGISIAQPIRPVVVLDGDGSLLMRMGSLAVNAAYSPQKMVHILFDNNAHESTGGQFTVSSTVDYPAVAKACGYKNVTVATDAPSLEKAVAVAQAQGGLHFIYVRIEQGAPENLGRPSIKPPAVARRLTNFLQESV